MVFRVLHHNQCFDGACSASIFTRLHRECLGGAEAYEYCGLTHKAGGGGLGEDIFGPGENAVVDFKYTSSPKLTWWFDHHISAFVTPEERAAYEAGQAGDKGKRQFFDPNYISCTSFIASVGASHFGFDVSGLGELLHWADIVDGARFESAKSAVEMKEPALQIAMVIENAVGPAFIPRIIPLLTEMSLADVLAQPFVKERVGPLMEKHLASMELIRERAEVKNGVIYVDLLDKQVEALNKFIPYYFYPEATYTVAATRSNQRAKISVGTSPWTKLPPSELINLAAICERYGGGGHARVGAVSLQASEVEKTSAVAEGIVAELRARGTA